MVCDLRRCARNVASNAPRRLLLGRLLQGHLLQGGSLLSSKDRSMLASASDSLHLQHSTLVMRATLKRVLFVLIAVGAAGEWCRAQDVSALAANKADAWEIIPETAIVAVAIQNVEQFRTRGDRFLEQAQVDNSFRLSDGYRWVVDTLGLQNLVDDQGSAALFAMPSNDQFLLEDLVLALPIADRTQLAARLGMTEEELENETIVDLSKRKGSLAGTIRFAMARGSHLFLSIREARLKACAETPSLSQSIEPSYLESTADDDLLIYVSPSDVDFDDTFEAEIDRILETAGQAEEVNDLKKLFGELDFVVGSANLETGLIVSTRMQFKGAFSRDWLAERLSTTAIGSGERTQTNSIQRFARVETAQIDPQLASALLVVPSIFPDLQNQQDFSLTTLLAPSHERLLSEMTLPIEHSSYEFFSLSGGLERGATPPQGNYAVRVGLYPRDTERYLDQLKELATFSQQGRLAPDAFRERVDAAAIEQLITQLGSPVYAEREQATIRLMLISRNIRDALQQALEADDLEIQARAKRILDDLENREAASASASPSTSPWLNLEPSFEYYEQAESVADHEVDVLKVDLHLPSTTETDWLQTAFGQDWNRWRVTHDDEQIVFFVGSDRNWLEAELGGELESIERSATREKFNARAPQHRSLDIELSLARLSGARPDGESSDISHASISVDRNGFRFDLYVPDRELPYAQELSGFWW